jgi:hypothetical protein
LRAEAQTRQKNANLQGIDGRSQLWSGSPKHVPVSAHDWGQMLMFPILHTFGDPNSPPAHCAMLLQEIIKTISKGECSGQKHVF